VPLLRELSLEASATLSGAAVVQALRLHPSLRYVNVTYCPLVGYLDTLRLRDCLGQPKVIVRRLPQEMCGTFLRPDDDADANSKCVGAVAKRRKTALCGSFSMTRPYFISSDVRLYRYWPDGTYQVDYTDGREVLGFVSLVRRSGAGVLTVNLQVITLEAFPAVFEVLPLTGSRQVLFAYGLTDQSQPPENWHTLMEPASMPLDEIFFLDANGVRQETENEESVFFTNRVQVLELDDPTTPDKTIATIWNEVNQLVVRQ
jgi:hypothetical protein